MIIDQLIEKIDDGSRRSYYSFETFVLQLLKHHIEKQKKELIIFNDRLSSFGDAIALTGFDNFSGPTLIEVKFALHSLSFKDCIFKSKYEYNINKFENLLILYAKPIPSEKLAFFNDYLKRTELPFKVFLWGPTDLNKIASQNKAIAKQIISNLFLLRLSSAISKPAKDWKKEREEILKVLKSYYEKGQFSLFLGAGVSSSAGMPNWNTLLNSLFVTYITQEFSNDVAISDQDISEIVARLNSINEPSALMAARYLRKGLSKNGEETKEFITAVTKNLYKLRDNSHPIDSELIKSIASMCIPKRTGAKIKSVITYNFDDLLERQLHKISIAHRCIYTNNESYDPDELPIYHVHGFLPEDRKKYDALDKSTLVFSEEGYHQIYSDAYHWSNLVQLNSFRENNCLMIGLSMTDPNLRRLLDISSKNNSYIKHFAFMKRVSSDEFCYKNLENEKIKVIQNTDSVENLLESHHALNEELMKELGVTIIWFESYDDIPEILKELATH